MKLKITLLLLAVAVLIPAQAQKSAVNESSTTTQTLLKLEHKWVDALAMADTITLDSIFADTYVDTDEASHRSDKQGVLAVLKSGQLKIESITLSNMKVYDYGDAAVVTGSSAQKGSFEGQSLAASVIFTDTFIRQNGKWKAVASHRSSAEHLSA